MKYENADNIFPEKLLLEIRRFMPEGYVYISPQSDRKEWESVSGPKQELEKRNSEIIETYVMKSRSFRTVAFLLKMLQKVFNNGNSKFM